MTCLRRSGYAQAGRSKNRNFCVTINFSRITGREATTIFGFGGKARNEAVDRRQSLAGIPVLNENVSYADEENGRVMINVRIRRGRGFLARFQPAVMERNVRLDEVGSFVFRLIDNERSVLEIMEIFLAKYRVNRREATLSVVDFLKSLVKRGIISIIIK